MTLVCLESGSVYPKKAFIVQENSTQNILPLKMPSMQSRHVQIIICLGLSLAPVEVWHTVNASQIVHKAAWSLRSFKSRVIHQSELSNLAQKVCQKRICGHGDTCCLCPVIGQPHCSTITTTSPPPCTPNHPAKAGSITMSCVLCWHIFHARLNDFENNHPPTQ